MFNLGGTDHGAFVKIAGTTMSDRIVQLLMARPAPARAQAMNPVGLAVWIGDGQSIDMAIREGDDLSPPNDEPEQGNFIGYQGISFP